MRIPPKMYHRFQLLAITLLFATVCNAGPEPPSFHSEVNLVNVTAVVRSTDGTLLRNLNKYDFELTEDGVPQTIQFFAHETDLPLSLGIIVDVSGSQDKFLKRHNKDVEVFLKTVLTPSDQAFAVCFGNHLRLVNDYTSISSNIMEGLKRFQEGSRRFPELGPSESRDLGTALYDAIYFSIEEKLKTDGQRRRALIVFSDGEENSSEHDLLDVVEASQNTDTVVYSIRYTEMEHGKLSARNRFGMRVMDHISSLSGGADFDALAAHLSEVFARISEELRGMYQIGYVSSNGHAHDGLFRKVIVRAKQPQTSVRSKSGYYAK